MTSGSIAVPPFPTRRTASRKSSISSTRSFSRYPNPSADSLTSVSACVASITCERRSTADLGLLRADLDRRPRALVGLRRRHAHVDDRDVRLEAADGLLQLVRVRRLRGHLESAVA